MGGNRCENAFLHLFNHQSFAFDILNLTFKICAVQKKIPHKNIWCICKYTVTRLVNIIRNNIIEGQLSLIERLLMETAITKNHLNCF